MYIIIMKQAMALTVEYYIHLNKSTVLVLHRKKALCFFLWAITVFWKAFPPKIRPWDINVNGDGEPKSFLRILNFTSVSLPRV